ncbi:MAG: TIGR03790 family protein [Acidobacteriota bacterium]
MLLHRLRFPCLPLFLAALALPPTPVRAQGPANVLVVVNDASALSRSIGEYYAQRRSIPLKNVCHIKASLAEVIERPDYNRSVAAPVTGCLQRQQLVEQILYIATTAGVPLSIAGKTGATGDYASVDSELATLYGDLKDGHGHSLNGPLRNPLFGKREAAFTHANFPIYLVTRLEAYDFEGVKRMIDSGLAAENRGKFVIDLKSNDEEPGNDWLRRAMLLLPEDRVIFDESSKVLLNQTDVIGYAGWGSNDPNRKQRFLGFKWLPGAVATEYVSTNARTFARPPKTWNISDWGVLSRPLWFAGSPQTMTADYVEEGASAATGHVTEPFLATTPHPEYLLPAYFKGRNLAESFYLSIPALSWQNIVIGDPLMSLGAPPLPARLSGK